MFSILENNLHFFSQFRKIKTDPLILHFSVLAWDLCSRCELEYREVFYVRLLNITKKTLLRAYVCNFGF